MCHPFPLAARRKPVMAHLVLLALGTSTRALARTRVVWHAQGGRGRQMLSRSERMSSLTRRDLQLASPQRLGHTDTNAALELRKKTRRLIATKMYDIIGGRIWRTHKIVYNSYVSNLVSGSSFVHQSSSQK